MTDLKGMSVLVTRPGRQGKILSRKIVCRGGRSILCPMMEIRGATETQAAREVAKSIGNYDVAIFISRNAVRYGLKTLADVGKKLPLMDVYAVGPATAMELKLAGVERVTFPCPPYSSEQLLGLESFRMSSLKGRRAVIFRGKGGRPMLASKLEERGMDVSYCECYERLPPPMLLGEQLNAIGILTPDIGLATSEESLNNLASAIRRDRIPNLFGMQMLVVSDRLGLRSKELGFTKVPLITRESSNEVILEKITQWAGNQR